jgi:hypothetical protein
VALALTRLPDLISVRGFCGPVARAADESLLGMSRNNPTGDERGSGRSVLTEVTV